MFLEMLIFLMSDLTICLDLILSSIKSCNSCNYSEDKKNICFLKKFVTLNIIDVLFTSERGSSSDLNNKTLKKVYGLIYNKTH